MNPEHISFIAQDLNIEPWQVEACAQLLAEDATVPFISRYRKEVTGTLDEVAVAGVRDRLAYLAALDARRDTILASLEKTGNLTDELEQKVNQADTLSELEDLYLPYRPKRRTKATMAKEKGLEPLADLLWEQGDEDPAQQAEAFVDTEKGVENAEDALAGARDILAERVAEDAEARAAMRTFYEKTAEFRTSVIEGEEAKGAKFQDYFDWAEPAGAAPSHRVLAMRRGETEGILDLAVEVPSEDAVERLAGMFVTEQNEAGNQVKEAVRDAFRRLLSRAMETEVRMEAKKRADEEAVAVFASNLKHLLLAPPLGQKRVLGVDPGLRTGCKLVFLDAQGALLHHDVIYLHGSEKGARDAEAKLMVLCEKYPVDAVAVGNGTAGRETEAWFRSVSLPGSPLVIMTDEAGASVYSASEAGREEFPDHDLTVRGAVSIGRRLMDPLAELVKIDPKSIGVGQYQHDVDQNMLKGSLDDVVVSCVNAVGVDVNTASARLLQYVSGLGPVLSKNMVAHRDQNGPFGSRKDLMKVNRLGPKAFEQAAGFLRVPGGTNPLDASAVHPEAYQVVEKMAADLGKTVQDLMADGELRKRIDLKKYVTDKLGLPTLTDILAELEKPGRDPREKLEVFSFDENVHDIADLEMGMELPGIVTNVTKFGAFVDVGVHNDGLVHISELADRFVKDPAEVVNVQQRVKVRVIALDLERKRIGLSMKSRPKEGEEPALASQKNGRPAGKAGPRNKGRGPGGAKGGPKGGQKPAAKPQGQPFNNAFGALAGLKGKK